MKILGPVKSVEILNHMIFKYRNDIQPKRWRGKNMNILNMWNELNA